MSGETSMEDLPLIDLFRSEVETHAEVLSAALLALEASPGDVSRLGEMMRAAHSIKGAARVVGVDPAVSVAHVMEDCFVAAQKKALTLSPADIDVLLRGVDLLGKISEATRDPKVDLANAFDGQVKAIVAELEAMLVPGPRRGASGTESQTSQVISPSAELASGNEIGRAARRAPSAADLPFRDDHNSRDPGFDGRRGDPQAVSHGDRGWLRLGSVRHEGDEGPRRARAGTPGGGRSPRRRPRSSAAPAGRRVDGDGNGAQRDGLEPALRRPPRTWRQRTNERWESRPTSS